MGNHCDSDQHHGQFDVNDNSFEYSFLDKEANEFTGIK